MTEEIEVSSRGLRLAAKVWGPRDGAPCLALHGWLDNANTYDRLAPLLPNLRLVAVDLPGHGASQHRSLDAEYHFLDWVWDVLEIATCLGWADFVLMGHSMGAGIASLVAGAFPQRVRQLICLDGFGPLSAEAQRTPELLAARHRELGRLQSKVSPVYKSREYIATQLARVVPGLSPQGAALLVQRGTHAVEGGVTWSSDARLRGTSVMRLMESQVHAFLAGITCPTLVVRARDGYPFDAEQLRQRFALVRQLRLFEVDGGHHVHLENPAVVARAVNDFLATPARAAV